MAIGDVMRLEGRLLVTGGGIGIELDDETIWFLELKGRSQPWIGQRVRVRGVQTAFDRVTVETIEPA